MSSSRYGYTPRITQGTETFYGVRLPVATYVRADDRFYEVSAQEYLPSIAHKMFGDARLWWVVADFNDIVTPMEPVLPGARLRVPSLNRLHMEVLR